MTAVLEDHIVDGLVATTYADIGDLTRDELRTGLRPEVVATAIQHKDLDDLVDLDTWWSVADTLEAVLLTTPDDTPRDLQVAVNLVARLLFSPYATSPTLLHVRLERLRTAVVRNRRL